MAGSIKGNHSGNQGHLLSGHPQTRFLWADVIRILAIFLVIATHLGYQPEFVTPSGLIYFLHFAVVKTCIPLFVMLSGALLLGKSESFGAFFRKRLGRLMLPWLFWSVIYLLVDRKFLLLIHDVPSFFRTLLWTMESFWFLPMIFGLYIVTPPLRIFIKNASLNKIVYVIILWFFVVSVLPYHHNSMAFPMQVDDGLLRQVINFLGYYFLGYLIIVLKGKITLVGSLLTFLLGLSWTTIMLLQNLLTAQQVMFLFDYISPGTILMSVGIFSFLVRLFGNRTVPENRPGKIISAFSGAALGIYLVHALLLPFIHTYIHVTGDLFLNRTISALILFGLCFVIIFLLQQIPLIKKFVS